LVKDRTSAQKVSPKLVLKAFKTLNEQLKFFSTEAMRSSKLVDMVYPGLASIATKAITDDYKCNLKTKLVILSLWRDSTEVQLSSFKSSLICYRDATLKQSKEQRSLAFKSLISSKNQSARNPSQAPESQAVEVEEGIERFSECVEYITKFLHKNMTHHALLQQLITFASIVLNGVPTDAYKSLTFNLMLLSMISSEILQESS
jgi:hypothetical protein